MSNLQSPDPSTSGPPDQGARHIRGAHTAGPTDIDGRPLAPWWRRVVAFVIDIVLMGVVFAILDLVLSGNDRVWVSAVALVIQIAYFSLLNGSAHGQTMGKMAMHIAVRDMDSGGPAGTYRALARAVTQYVMLALFVVPWLIDVLWPLWDPQRQAWHDKAVRTVVVEVP